MSVLELAAVEPVLVPIADLKIEPDLQCRVKGTQADVVAEYSEAMKRGDVFPPCVAFKDARGTWLANGFHRVAAASKAGFLEILCDVRAGSKRDALMHAISADQAVGLRRTTQDKRRSIELAIRAFPKMSNRQIGKAVGVDDKTVAATRKRLEEPSASAEIPQGEPQPADPLEKPLARFRSILALVPEAERSRFAELVLAMLTAPTE